ncbi:UvrABC system protein A [compost metagenome]
MIKTADYIIDMGPEGGSGGGTVLATGTPEKIIEVEESYTGTYLKPVLIRDTERTKALELQTSDIG